jgi:hypothetical protein
VSGSAHRQEVDWRLVGVTTPWEVDVPFSSVKSVVISIILSGLNLGQEKKNGELV